MIYYKKKSWLKKIFKKRSIECASCFKILKILPAVFLIFIALIYTSYLILLPKFFNEEKTEAFLNNYLTKNSKLTLHIDDLKISPNYKFDIHINASKIRINYSNNKNFITLNKPSIDINLINLFFNTLDLNSIKTQSIVVNTRFTKNKKYDCMDYFNFDILNFQSNNVPFKLRNIRINSDQFVLNLFDENINKKFTTKTSKIKLSLSEINKPAQLLTKGEILSPSGKILDFNLNLEFLLKQNIVTQLRDDITKMNYNPLKIADETNFYSKADINLKTFKNNKTNLNGQIKLEDLSFNIKDIKLPKNNIILTFKDNLIASRCNFKLNKTQFINVNLKANVSDKKYIEAILKSNDINLKELNNYISTLSKILNLKINTSKIELSGLLNADIYLNSNFKTINSKGSLLIKDAKIVDKSSMLKIDNINSKINLENNKINIQNASALINNSKFYLTGIVDEKTNMDIKITSDLLDVAKLINFIKTLSYFKSYNSALNNYTFKSGLMEFRGSIKGNFNKPIVEARANIKNLKVNLKQQKIDLFSQSIEILSPQNNNNFIINTKNLIINYKNNVIKNDSAKISIVNDTAVIERTKVTLDNINSFVNLKISELYSKSPKINLNLEADIPAKNDILIIKNQNPKLKASLLINGDNLSIANCEVLSQNKKLLTISGSIKDIQAQYPKADNIKILIPEKIGMIIPALNNVSFEALGQLSLSGSLNKPQIDGDLKLYNIIYREFGLFISDLMLNINKSAFYLNITDAQMLGFDFDLVAQAKFDNNKLIVEFAQFNSNYIDLDKVRKLIKLNSKNVFDFEVQNLKGNISSLKTEGIILNSIYFNGSIKDDVVKINNFGADIFAGKIIGTMVINLVNFKTKADIIAKDLSVRHFTSNLKELSIAISGRLSAFISAEFVGFSYDDILKSFNGYVKFNIQDGELNHFARLERLLQAGNILSQSVLKLTINSIASVVTKHNTGDFKTIDGVMKIKDSIADIQYIKTQGTNMSLYLTGKLNLYTHHCNVRILGRIPQSMVSVMGDVGRFSTEKIVNKMSDDTKQIIKTITVSPIEKLLSTRLSKNEVEKIPELVNQDANQTREFVVDIDGLASDTHSIKLFKWHKKAENE